LCVSPALDPAENPKGVFPQASPEECSPQIQHKNRDWVVGRQELTENSYALWSTYRACATDRFML